MTRRVHGMARAVGVRLQCEPLCSSVVIDLDAERDSWREETEGCGRRGRRERRGQRGDGEQAASQLAPT